MNQVRLRQNAFGRWIIVDAVDERTAWSGSRFVPITDERRGGVSPATHELVHVGQYRRGELTRLKYIRELVKHGSGTKNKYEVPAYGMEDDIKFSLPALLKAFGKEGPTCDCGQQ